MHRVLSLVMFLLFFKPFSAIAYVVAVAFFSLICAFRVTRSRTFLDFMIICVSIVGSFFSVLKVSHVYASSGFLAAIFYVSFYYVVILIVLIDLRHEWIIRRLYGLIFTFGLPILIFAGLLIGPASSTFNGYASIPSLFGLEINRMLFPFTGGVNHFGIVLGFCLAVASAFKLNSLQVFTWWVGVFVLLTLIDSRGAVLALIAALLFSKWKFITAYIWLIVPAAMVLVGLTLVTSNDLILNRDNSTLFSQREYLWALGISGLSVMTWENFLTGYGVSGFTYNSTASIVTEFFEYRNTIGSLHNAHLTLIYDYGILGLVLIVFVNLKIIKNLKYLTCELRELSYKCLIYTAITSATETIYSFNYILILFTIIFISQFKNSCFNMGKLT